MGRRRWCGQTGAPAGNHGLEDRDASLIAACLDLAVQLHAIVTTRCPAFPQISQVGIEAAAPTRARRSGRQHGVRRGTCAHILAYGVAREGKLASELADPHALSEARPDRAEA